MGGESAPWGVAYKTKAAGLRVLTVPEPRNRDLVAEMLASFAPVLLEHLGHPGFCKTAFDPSITPLHQLRVRTRLTPTCFTS